jgi:hypothetical protein
MRGFRVWVPVLALAALAACGGGGGGGGGGDGAAAVEPTVAFVLDEDNLSDTLALGDELSFRLAGHWSSSDAGLTSVYLQVVDAADAFVPAAPVASDGTVALDLAVRSVLPVGLHESQLHLRACRDAACANPLPGRATIAYRLTVDPVSDWSTHQGNNAHRGAVPIRLDPSKFAQAWSWRRPAGTEPIGGINPVVTSAGKVFVTTDVYFGGRDLRAGRVGWP